jgi:CIC family chloride channel protein
MKASPLYHIDPFAVPSAGELAGCLVIGLAASLAIWAFLQAMQKSEELFERVPKALRLPLGGLLLGCVSTVFFHVWGGGHETIGWLMDGSRPTGALGDVPMWSFVALLLVAKIVATAITLGSGGWGGVFTPNIMLGCCVGLLFPLVAPHLAPSVDPHSFGVIGMAAGLAAATQAPIMAMIFVIEMTRQPSLITGLMVGSISASLSARALGLTSIYVSPLVKRGVKVPEGIEETTLTLTRVKDLMREEVVRVEMGATFDAIVGVFQRTRRDTIYVVSPTQELLGVVRLHDIKNFLTDPELGAAVIAADVLAPIARSNPEQTLADVIELFDDAELHEVAVVDPGSGRLIGAVDRRDFITQLSVEVLQRRGLRAKFVDHEGAQHYVEMPAGHALSRIPVPREMAGQTLAGAQFHRHTGLTVLTIVQSVSGRDRRILPEPSTTLRAGDSLIVLGPVESIRRWGGAT